MGKGFAKKKKQARMMQEQFSELQKQMEETEVTGIAGNGLVTITLSGKNEMKKITIKPECVDAEDIDGLQDLIKAAYNDASKQLEANTPGLDNLPNLGGGMPNLGSFGF